mmetsp:Transcript_29692/g.82967  ORF Transcript_29692/g.82967 Transcript_29692/m.82967 type:complete len:207 (+) Transcript_29692:879-1499(+)
MAWRRPRYWKSVMKRTGPERCCRWRSMTVPPFRRSLLVSLSRRRVSPFVFQAIRWWWWTLIRKSRYLRIVSGNSGLAAHHCVTRATGRTQRRPSPPFEPDSPATRDPSQTRTGSALETLGLFTRVLCTWRLAYPMSLLCTAQITFPLILNRKSNHATAPFVKEIVSSSRLLAASTRCGTRKRSFLLSGREVSWLWSWPSCEKKTTW